RSPPSPPGAHRSCAACISAICATPRSGEAQASRAAGVGAQVAAPPRAEKENPAWPGFSGNTSVADLLLQVLPALLLVDGALRGQARIQPVKADLLARVHAVAVFTRIHALERAVDLADQLAVAVAGTQFQ